MIIGGSRTGARILLERAPVRMQYFGRSTIDGNYMKNPIFPEDGESQKEEPRRAAMGPPHRPARALPCPRCLVGRGPTTPLGRLSSAYFIYPET